MAPSTLSPEAVRAALTVAPAFATLPPQALDLLAQAATQQTLAVGQALGGEDHPIRAAWVVLDGVLHPRQAQAQGDGSDGEDSHESVSCGLLPAGPGALLDETAVVLGGPHEAAWHCASGARLLRIPLPALHALAQSHPQAWDVLEDRANTCMLAAALRSALRTALPGCDSEALIARAFAEGRWWHMARGEPLFQAGEPFDAWYVLVSGELAELAPRQGRLALHGLLHPGDLVGDGAALSGEAHATTVVARRDAWLLRLDAPDFATLVLGHAGTVQQVARNAVRRAVQPRRPVSLDATIALLPMAGHGGAAALADQLAHALRALSPLVVLDAAACESLGVVRGLRQRQRADLQWLRLDAWLDAQHRRGRRVLLVGDAADTPWSRRAALVADRILLVADGDTAPDTSPGATPPVWQAQGAQGTAEPWQAQHWLCLTHAPALARPAGTAAWLQALAPQRHFHARLGHAGDLARLARHLAGQAIGLALSGGGARGPAHAGVFHALEDAGIPVDFVAGTSAGSLMACLFAQDEGWARCARRAIDGIGPPPGPFSDFTLPVVSLLKSQRLHDSVRATYNDELLEDSWIPCAVVATNLTRLRRVVFTRGPTWRATLASISPPAVAKPRVIDGDLVCDGGLIENMPVSVLIEHGCRHVIASNIATALTVALDADDFPGPWRILADRLLRGGRATAGVPTAVEILLAATTLASEDARAAAADLVDLELSPDLASFKSVDFKRSRELVDTAYADAGAALRVARVRDPGAALWRLAQTDKQPPGAPL